jgi:hypothetical protein
MVNDSDSATVTFELHFSHLFMSNLMLFSHSLQNMAALIPFLTTVKMFELQTITFFPSAKNITSIPSFLATQSIKLTTYKKEPCLSRTVIYMFIL